MVLRNAFSLLSLFTLCSAVTDRNGCTEIPAVSGRAMVDMTCPFVEVPQPEMLKGITWVHNTTSTLLDMIDQRYIQTGNEFRILNIVPGDEGVYSCIFEIAGGDVNRSVSLVSTCIIVEAQAIFQACEMMSCNTGLLNSIEGGSVTIDSRVGFINGGACRINQSITLMVLRKEGGSPIYTCSNEGVQNIGRDCTSNERVQVTPPGEHKYDFNLTLTNVTNDDRGNYFLHVEFVNDLGSRSCLYQNFTLSISNTLANAQDDCSGQSGAVRCPWESFCLHSFGSSAVCVDGYCQCPNSNEYDPCTCLPSVASCTIQLNAASAVAAPTHDNVDGEIYSCVSNANCNYDVHVLSCYEAVTGSFRQHPTGRSTVSISASGQQTNSIVLVLVSYEAIRWTLSIPSHVAIDTVIVISYYASSISGGGSISVETPARGEIPCGYGEDSGGGDTVGLLQYLVERFGHVSSFTGTYRADHWSVNINLQPQEPCVVYTPPPTPSLTPTLPPTLPPALPSPIDGASTTTASTVTPVVPSTSGLNVTTAPNDATRIYLASLVAVLAIVAIVCFVGVLVGACLVYNRKHSKRHTVVLKTEVPVFMAVEMSKMPEESYCTVTPLDAPSEFTDEYFSMRFDAEVSCTVHIDPPS